MEGIGFETERIVEGRARLLVPAHSSSVPPSHLPVFFNPRSKVSRDIAVLVTSTYFKGRGGLEMIEPLTGLGARIIRLMLEAGVFERGLGVDRNELAVRLARMNCELNGLTGRLDFVRSDANLVLVEAAAEGRRYDYVDIDPSGSHVPYIENGIRACRIGGLLGVSATDLAALSGSSPQTSEWRYGVSSCRTPFLKEVALRTMIYSVIRSAARLEMVASPVLSAYVSFFVRAFFTLDRGVTKVRQLLRKIGYLSYCERCYDVRRFGSLSDIELTCRFCSSRVKVIGPLYLGELSSPEFCRATLASGDREEFREAHSIVSKIADELQDVPYYYPVSLIARLARKSTPSPIKLVNTLRIIGYRATLTHFDPSAVKTDAELMEVVRLVSAS